jgi:hypothetical protein
LVPEIMTITLCPVPTAALDKLPAKTDDKSGVGVHYVDAYLKAISVKRDDGIAVKGKRRGLKVVLSVKGGAGAARTGEGLLRRLANGPDPVAMLDAALQEAAGQAGVALAVADGQVTLTLPE